MKSANDPNDGDQHPQRLLFGVIGINLSVEHPVTHVYSLILNINDDASRWHVATLFTSGPSRHLGNCSTKESENALNISWMALFQSPNVSKGDGITPGSWRTSLASGYCGKTRVAYKEKKKEFMEGKNTRGIYIGCARTQVVHGTKLWRWTPWWTKPQRHVVRVHVKRLSGDGCQIHRTWGKEQNHSRVSTGIIGVLCSEERESDGTS